MRARLIRVVAADALPVAICLTLTGEQLRHGGLTAPVLLAAALVPVLRRRAPVAVTWLVAGATAALPFLPGGIPGNPDLLWWPPAAPFAAYAAMVFAADRRTAMIPVAALVVLTALIFRPWEAWVEIGLRTSLITFAAALLGLYVAARRQLLASLRERAERAERERHLMAEQARGEERVRLAAEIHDVVTHRVSLMVLQAGALQVSATDDRTEEAAEALRTTGCQALAELRDLVGILRDADGDADHATMPQPVLPDLGTLIAESESVGVPVELAERGDRSPLSPVVGRTAHRIVQEALTNVRKHAPGASARVEAHYDREVVRLTVRNTAPTRPADPALAGPGPGTGLLGLRQRVELVNGTLVARPRGDGGFELQATLPTQVTAST
ncbi:MULTISPECIES: sensor histidine kinase [unclassified Nonomuraea]|uniref:sensor histidine kinase n=1 Tax=unclassified Nonomuraea TaxID=2593643 RepID=UPI00191C1D53|nr:histidine kinase [Nonomuraea sp. KC401]